MSTPSSRRSSFYGDLLPATPDSPRSSASRSGGFSVAPKSEYLKNAIHARRSQSQTTPTRTPPDLKLKSSSPAPSAHEVPKPEVSPDIFLQYALSEEQTAPVSPIQRRRPSDFGYASKTNRELSKEVEQLKESLMTANMRVELLDKNRKETQVKLTSALEELERLEPCQDEVQQLRAENQHLKLKMEKMKDEMERLKAVNEDHRKINEELTAIASESATHWSAHEAAIEEAAECIIAMEEEKAVLTKELRELKERVTAIEFASSQSSLIPGPDKYPSRVYSVDESRPSTSHFDSDYYSQPSSPQVKKEKRSSESFKTFVPSERSKKFLDLTEQHRQSARQLVQRMSVVSLRALRDETPCSACEQKMAPVQEEEDRSPTPRDPSGRYRGDHQTPSPSLMDAAEISPSRPHTVAPYAETASRSGGLRNLYRSDRPLSRRTSEYRPSSTQRRNPTNTDRFASRPQTTYETWHRPSTSSGSEVDLASVVDPREDKERWWRSMDRLNFEQVIDHYSTPSGSQISNADTATVQARQPKKVHSVDTLSESRRQERKATPPAKHERLDRNLSSRVEGFGKDYARPPTSRRLSTPLQPLLHPGMLK
ncbi:uncharacterized protein yc1106_08716 [Curvularia clavata]|uniref:Uncharacterized protein n=1 Tax=Curvularia clavata TaxID=95742 RepID=A0A9Q9DW24_CURCL|nr:uncharacterized protein yc1106_08716 [Curvularia clavata]